MKKLSLVSVFFLSFLAVNAFAICTPWTGPQSGGGSTWVNYTQAQSR